MVLPENTQTRWNQVNFKVICRGKGQGLGRTYLDEGKGRGGTSLLMPSQ